jgi:hypothetical protein
MQPNGFHRVEPRAFGWQQTGQETDALFLLLDLQVVLADPPDYFLGYVLGSSVPNDDYHTLTPFFGHG